MLRRISLGVATSGLSGIYDGGRVRTVARWLTRTVWGCSASGKPPRSGAREHEREPAARADLALRTQLAAHPHRQIAADREPEPHPLLARRREVPIHLHEGIEDPLELVGRDPSPRVP